VLTKDKDKNRWSIAEPIKADAETSKITDLLDKLAGMQARDKDVLDKADPKSMASTLRARHRQGRGDGERGA
jgi:hypothetical protein